MMLKEVARGLASRPDNQTHRVRFMSIKGAVTESTGAIASILLATVLAFGQQAAPEPAVRPGLNLPEPGVAETRTSAQPAYLTQIRGLQGVLAETLDGSTVAAQAVDGKFNPASSIKLATALAALKTFGPEHRFLTSVWTTGKIDRATGALNGDLIVAGSDPSFHYEHAVMLARELNELGIRTISGKLIISPGFTMNFDWSTKRSGEQLRDTLDTTRRSTAAMRAWTDERTLVNDAASLGTVPSVVVLGEVAVDAAPPQASALLTHKSSKLADILKVLLCYSNNFMAERIGDTVGGPAAVRTMLLEKLKISADEFFISSTSGLGANRVTPRAMMKILRGLRDELTQRNLSLSDILPVAGVDPGTLEDRFTTDAARGSVVAKTGTLARTDGGASSLVGQMKTKSGRVVLFVILNEHGNVLRFRQNQDEIVAAIQSSLGGPAPFAYRPVALAMRLADSDFAAAKARGEYEPRNQH
jgi:D-alanyl-D-alanine carboxypeptidase/D-alanyl-D-alanine-endopeptidase (penicillin-binding protein 4)